MIFFTVRYSCGRSDWLDYKSFITYEEAMEALKDVFSKRIYAKVAVITAFEYVLGLEGRQFVWQDKEVARYDLQEDADAEPTL